MRWAVNPDLCREQANWEREGMRPGCGNMTSGEILKIRYSLAALQMCTHRGVAQTQNGHVGKAYIGENFFFFKKRHLP